MAGSPYKLDFGSANAGGSPAFLLFANAATNVAITPPPITEIGVGLYQFAYDWTTAPLGVTAIVFKAALAGVELSDVLQNPLVSQPVVPTSTGTGKGYDTSALVASVKRRASVPTTQATIDAQGFLDIANEELQSYVVPVVLEARSDYLVAHTDLPLVGTTFRVPKRAIGGKLREVQLLDAAAASGKPGNISNVPQVTVDQLDAVRFGFYLEGNVLNLWNALQPLNAQWTTIRLSFYSRPNALVYPSAVAVVQSIAGNALTLASVPSGFTSSALYDVVRANPGFEWLATDQAATLSGSVLTLASVPSELVAGDYVCLAGQSPVPQIPAELHPLLAQAMAVKVLQAICDDQGLQAAMALIGRMEKDARGLISQRVDGDPVQVVCRNSLLRSYW